MTAIGALAAILALVPELKEREKEIARVVWTEHPHYLIGGLAVVAAALAWRSSRTDRRDASTTSDEAADRAEEAQRELAQLREDLEQALGERRTFRNQLDELAAEFQYLGEEVEKRGRQLRLLRDLVVEYSPAEQVIELLRIEIVVRPGGDISVTRTTRVRLEGTNPLHFFRFQLTGEALTEAERRAVRPEVRMEPGGGALDLQVDWESPKHALVFADFLRPRSPKDPPFTLVLTYELPHALPKLYGRGAENIMWTNRKGIPLERFEYRILVEELPAERKINYVNVGMKTDPQVDRKGGRWLIEGYEEQLTEEVFGVRLDSASD